MLTVLVRRIGTAIPTLLVIVALTFFMIRAAPGGPFDQERRLPAEVEANLNRVYHLDEPLPLQFLRYLGHVAVGDFGPSFRYRDQSVAQLIGNGAPVSIRLGLTAIALATVIGVTLGLVAAWRQNSGLDHAVMALAMTGIAIPNFVMGPLLALLFGLYLHLLPVEGWDSLRSAVLPVVALTLPQIAYIARLSRASALEVLRSNYIRTARAKGLPERLVLSRHAVKAAVLPVVSYLGPAAANVMTGSVVVENIFAIPGMGRYFIQGGLNRDYLLVMGCVIFYGVLIIAMNLIVDLTYGLLDPKIRLSA